MPEKMCTKNSDEANIEIWWKFLRTTEKSQKKNISKKYQIPNDSPYTYTHIY